MTLTLALTLTLTQVTLTLALALTRTQVTLTLTQVTLTQVTLTLTLTLTLTQVTATDGTKSSFAGSDGDTTFTLDFNPAASVEDRDTIKLEMAAGAATDAAGNANVATADLSRIYDPNDPTAVISVSAGSIHAGVQYVNINPVMVTLTFDEPVFGLAVEALQVAGNPNPNPNLSLNPTSQP